MRAARSANETFCNAFRPTTAATSHLRNREERYSFGEVVHIAHLYVDPAASKCKRLHNSRLLLPIVETTTPDDTRDGRHTGSPRSARRDVGPRQKKKRMSSSRMELVHENRSVVRWRYTCI